MTKISKKRRRRGFTLIELLVVFSIISLLSSITLAAVNSARERARIAAGLKYSTSIARSIPAIGYWKFDEGAGASVTDYSDFGNAGTIQGAQWSTDVPHPSKRTSLYFDGASSITVPLADGGPTTLDLSAEGYTFMAWTKPMSFGTAPAGVVFMTRAGSPQLGFSADGRVRFNIVAGNWFFSDSAVPLGKWSHIAAVYEGGLVYLYVNGKPAATPAAGPAPVNQPFWDFIIGSYIFGSNPYMGYLDEVAVLNNALTSAQIEKVYAEGAGLFLAKE